MKTITLNIPGLTCHECSKKVENILIKSSNIYNYKFNFKSQTLTLSISSKNFDLNKLINQIKKLGYEVIL